MSVSHPQRICRACHCPFTDENPTVTICQECWNKQWERIGVILTAEPEQGKEE